MSYFYPEPGTVLAERYRVVRTIGRGGMGVVLEAQNTVTQKRVALKWLHANLAGSPEAAERLVREATAAARISHPNVVDVYDVLQDGSTIFLVMDLLRGEPLAAALERGALPLHQVVSLLLPAMHGVAEAHLHGIIHRDIHPGNIFLAQEGNNPRPVPKVLDFGISKIADTEQRALTRSNISMGTPLYMSYEQLYSSRDVDQRTDVYSLGVVLYEALTGQRPYDGESFMEVAGKITAANPVHPRQLRPDMPPALAALVLRAMARSRDDRIQTVAELIAELQPYAKQQAYGAAARGKPLAQADEDEGDAYTFLPRGSPGTMPVPRGAPAAVRVDTRGRVSRPLAGSGAGSSPAQRGRTRTIAIAVGALLCIAGLSGALWVVRMRQDGEQVAGSRGPALPVTTAAGADSEPSQAAAGVHTAPDPSGDAPSQVPSEMAATHVDDSGAGPAPAKPLAPPAATGKLPGQPRWGNAVQPQHAGQAEKSRKFARAGELRDEDL